MNKFIIIIIILSGLATFLASGQEKREFRPLIPGRFTAASIVEAAKSWEGKHYRRGQSCQCANWVGEVIRSAGGSTPADSSMARSWLQWGYSVPIGSIKPGDVVVTWRGSRNGSSGHILIYIGDGQCIHRPTMSKPVQRISLANYTQTTLLGVRRKR